MEIVSPARELAVWKTPLYDQYWSLKDQSRGALLFFRLGDFYELFGQDAIDAAPLLEIQLTSRDKKNAHPIPMCGIPVHALEVYSEKLLSRGFKLALAEQFGEVKSGTLVERRLKKIITPGLPRRFEHMSESAHHLLLSLSYKNTSESYDVEAIDFLSSKRLSQKSLSREEVQELFIKNNIAEILLPEDSDLKSNEWSLLPKKYYSRTSFFGCSEAEANLKSYLKYTQVWADLELNEYLESTEALNLGKNDAGNDEIFIAPSIFTQWNIFPELFDHVNGTSSALSSRRLKEILTQATSNLNSLKQRNLLYASITSYEKKERILDVERLLGKTKIKSIHNDEFIKFFLHLEKIFFRMKSLKKEEREALCACLSLEELSTQELNPLLEKLKKFLNTDFDLFTAKKIEEFIQLEACPSFLKLKKTEDETQTWLNAYEKQLQGETGIQGLKIRYNKIFGFYIEVRKAHVSKVPSSFQRKQSMVAAERYFTEELKVKEDEILNAQKRLRERAEEIFQELKDDVLKNEKKISQVIREFSFYDAFYGVKRKITALERLGKWTLPEWKNSREFFFDYKDGRHPLIELIEGAFVANDLSLTKEKRLALLTGPNMAGKSTLMRQSALILYLAHCGFPVPASKLSLSPCSGFFSRMGASDHILEGESTFMVEMKECSQIVAHADERSFVLIDEIGRGTSTKDGLAIARSILEFFLKDDGPRIVFATHFHELSEVQDSKLFQISLQVKEWEGRLVFLRKIVYEAAQSSYGVEVAKKALLPDEIVQRSYELLNEEEKGPLQLAPQRKEKSRRSELSELPLFALPQVNKEEQKVLASLKKISLDDVTPKAAHNLLENWKSILGQASDAKS